MDELTNLQADIQTFVSEMAGGNDLPEPLSGSGDQLKKVLDEL